MQLCVLPADTSGITGPLPNPQGAGLPVRLQATNCRQLDGYCSAYELHDADASSC